LAIDFFSKIFGSANIDPPRRSRRMQGLPLEDPEVSQPLLPNPPEDSPQQSDIQDHIPSQAERTDTLESFRIVSDSLDAFRLPPGYERRILRLNSSGELVVDTSGIPTGITVGLENEDPFWTTDISRTPTSRRNPPSLEAEAEIPVVSDPPETSTSFMIPLDHFNNTTCYFFVGSEVGPSSTIPLQHAHSTMVPNTTIIPTGNMMASQPPIGTPRSSRQIPSHPLGYNALNASIPIPSQVPPRAYGVFTPPGYNVASGSILTPSKFLSEGSYPHFIGGFEPSVSTTFGISTPLFTSGYQIPIGGQYNPGGKLNLEVKPKLGHHPNLEDNPYSEDIIHNMDRTSPDH
jgi:hypothetical protein